MEFLSKFGIKINDQELLLTALTHSSYSNEHNVENYERLEFLGDAVLQILMSDYLYNNMELNEGDMSKTRASYVCESACVKYAEAINYKPYIRVGHGQINNVNDTIVADSSKENGKLIVSGLLNPSEQKEIREIQKKEQLKIEKENFD